MCFSTTASFTAGVVLTTIGVASIKKTSDVRKLMFACIPFIFALQQFSEGFVWITLLNNSEPSLQQIAINLFLVFALVFWPATVPLSIFLIEENRQRRITLGIIAGLGILFSILSIYYLLAYHSTALISKLHIHYQLDVPGHGKIILGFLYLVPTVLSLFISSVKKVPIMGCLVLLSYFVTKFLFDDYLLSIWCFFSATISLMIYYILSLNHSSSKTDPFRI